ncbi:DMT family transporter [Thalassococcus sp. BH17M4-6]|uniref:DMT family transporter n=1 Tax=Thalassococcus sp. BH17M4-6 TaxID=3413148 RepID=UPI003BD706CE
MTGAARGHLAMLSFSALVAGSFSLGGMAAPFIAPEVMTAARFVIAAVLLTGIAFAMGEMPRRAFAAPWRYVLLSGLFVFYFVMMFEGLKTAEPVSMAAVFTLNPILAGAFGWLLLRQVTTPRMATALVIGGIGALWVIFRADVSAFLAFQIGRGETVYFWGCLAHAFYIPLVRKLNRGESALTFNAGVVVAGAGLLLVYGGPAMLATDWAALPGIVWITLIYISIMATALTFPLLRFGSLNLPSAKVMAYTYLTPSWVLVWEVALGHGAPPTLVLPGVALTVLALLLLLRDEEAPGAGQVPGERKSADRR